MIKRLLIIALLVLVMSACTGAPPEQATPTAMPPTDALPSETPTEILPTETSTPSPTPEPTATTEFTPTPVVYGPHDFPVNVSPLSGKSVSDNALLERRPVAVKVQLFPRGQRPPWGVSLADIVYDYYQNFGLTRLHAIFYSQDAETVGPVRSARLLDQSLVHMYQSIFAFGSAEQRTYSRLIGSDFADRLVLENKTNCPPMCRVDPNGKNELTTNTAELSSYIREKGADDSRQNLDGMYFNQATPIGGQPSPQVFVRFSISAYLLWDYNPDTGRYLRYQDTLEAEDIALENVAALVDRTTNEQIAADNVVVILTPHQYAFDTHPGVNEVIDINLTGSGPAYAFRDGQVFQVVWNRPGKNSVLFLTFQDGSSYAFKPGNTWIEVIGTSSRVETPSPNMLRFTHAMP